MNKNLRKGLVAAGIIILLILITVLYGPVTEWMAWNNVQKSEDWEAAYTYLDDYGYEARYKDSAEALLIQRSMNQLEGIESNDLKKIAELTGLSKVDFPWWLRKERNQYIDEGLLALAGKIADAYDNQSILRSMQYLILEPFAMKPELLTKDQISYIKPFLTPLWMWNNWDEFNKYLRRYVVGTVDNQALITLAQHMPGKDETATLREDFEYHIVHFAMEKYGLLPSQFKTLLKDFFTPEWIVTHGQNENRGDLLFVAANMRTAYQPETKDDKYDKAFSQYLENAGQQSDPTAGRVFYKLLDRQRRSRSASLPIAFRQKETKYQTLTTSDIPFTVRLKMNSENRELIQPDETVFSEQKTKEREEMMLDHVVQGLNQIFGDDVLPLEKSTEEVVEETGAGILIDYTLIPEGYRWGDPLSEELGKLVTVDFYIEWEVSFLPGKGEIPKVWEFTSRPPETVTIDMTFLRGQYARIFDYIIIDAIKNFEEKFFERLGIQFNFDDPHLIARLRKHIMDEYLLGNIKDLKGIASILYYAGDNVHSRLAQKVWCKVPELLGALDVIMEGRDPGKEIKSKPVGYIPIYNYSTLVIGDKLDDTLLTMDSDKWFFYDAVINPTQLTLTIDHIEKSLDIFVHKALPDRSGAYSKPVAFRYGTQSKRDLNIDLSLGRYFIRVSNPSSSTIDFGLQSSRTEKTNSWNKWIPVIQPDVADLEHFITQMEEENKQPEEELLWILAHQMKDETGFDSCLQKAAELAERSEIYLSIYPNKINSTIQNAQSFNELTQLATFVPSRRTELAPVALRLVSCDKEMHDYIEHFGLNMDAQNKWRQQLLAERIDEENTLTPKSFLNYLATIPKYDRMDSPLRDAFIRTLDEYSDKNETDAKLKTQFKSTISEAIVDYHYLTGDDLLPFKTVWSKDIEVQIQGIKSKSSSSSLAASRMNTALSSPIVRLQTKSYSTSDSLEGMNKNYFSNHVAAYLHIFPEEKKNHAKSMFDLITSTNQPYGLQTYLELFPTTDYKLEKEQIDTLISNVSKAKDYVTLLDEFPEMKEEIKIKFQSMVLSTPRAFSTEPDPISRKYTISIANKDEIYENLELYLNKFPEEQDAMFLALKLAIDSAIQMEDSRRQNSSSTLDRWNTNPSRTNPYNTNPYKTNPWR